LGKNEFGHIFFALAFAGLFAARTELRATTGMLFSPNTPVMIGANSSGTWMSSLGQRNCVPVRECWYMNVLTPKARLIAPTEPTK
jgi:hypothetical protein